MQYPINSKKNASNRPSGRKLSRTLPPRANIASLPVAAFRERAVHGNVRRSGLAVSEKWHEPRGGGPTQFIVHPPGGGFVHPVTVEEVRDRLAELPRQFTRDLEVVQFSTMTRKRQTFPCYGMQWGTAVYLYPIEQGFVEDYAAPPTPQQRIEARMFGGRWVQEGGRWKLVWTPAAIKDFYLNNVLIHELGHLNDPRNNCPRDRERFANWFAIEYGYRKKGRSTA
jgi:hypothetical protein